MLDPPDLNVGGTVYHRYCLRVAVRGRAGRITVCNPFPERDIFV